MGHKAFPLLLKAATLTLAGVLNAAGMFSPFISLLDPFSSEIRCETRLGYSVTMHPGHVTGKQ